MPCASRPLLGKGEPRAKRSGGERKNDALSSRPAAGIATRCAHEQRNVDTALKGKTRDEAQMF